ncbi:ubiquitin specific protease 66, putative [Perkinsus marinus ATCC 50983]|uniref:Ubiquitin carboxyl-terminal hydrolase n=1 Tax=Perkinsus marinus (strain ATCC 50983 / TXsc) TaxID=423536 RepID=C5LMD8_PERM5|nr:ubiquitin specific protease 66, putative [Perkinsus marinus ATCC 50983]EER02150.1 ubiquitin specific protease 66, putative [Perkinsus marinus ATCC 50983]|eukprot:XP_002769432.1 ubiquitin specific protease 66, putative [Perkinsus marinus ATCC 50983]
MSPLPEQSRSVLGYGDSPSNTSLRASIDAANMELLLPRRIEFVRASAQVTAKSLSGLDKKDDAPQRPNKWVFPEGGLEQYHGWRTSKSYGAGLRNQGNTCYLNSTLQCLSYVSTFAQASEAKIHERTCPRKRAGVWCGLCNLSNLVCRIHQSHGGHLSPTEVLRHLNLYFARFRPGRQEDAHDALRQLIDTCIRSEALPAKVSPSAQNKKAPFVHPSVSQTTMLGQMFGYHTAQRIQCANCGHVSCTFHFDMDISLSISRCRTIDECLTRYFAPEIFKEQNAYKCAKCKRTVTAKKSTRLYDAPMNLTLSLKRYCYGRFGGRRQKDGHYVKYEKELDLSKFIADHRASTPGVSNKYILSGVLVHSGATPQLGHYYAFVRNPAGFWYCCDDESVTPAKEHTVLSQQAYILFYERKRSKKDSKSQRHLSVESEPTVSTTNTDQNKAKKAVPAPLQQHQSLFYNSLTTPPDTPSTTAGELDNHAVSSGSVSSSVTTLTGDEEVHKEAAPTDRKRKHAVEDVESPQKKAHVDAKGETCILAIPAVPCCITLVVVPPAAAGLQQAVFVRMHPPKFGDEEKSNDNSDPDEEEDLPSEPVANQEEDPVVGQATKLAEVVRVESCGTAATIKPKERASLARSVRSQYGANKVSSWDSDDDEEKEEGREEVERARKEAIIQAQRQLQPKIAMRDSHDREYDKGKNRHKVRQHVEAKDNDFAAAYKRAKARLHGPRNKQQLMRDKRLHNRCQRRKGKPTITKSSS